MKLTPVPLAASLALNIGVLAFYFVQRPSPTSVADRETASRAVVSSSATSSKTLESYSALDPAKTAALAQLRTQFQTNDLPALVAQLRAAGFPISMIRAIVGAQVYEQFAARRKALLAANPDREYWSTKGGYAYIDPKIQTALRGLYQEQTTAMKSLLGADAQDPVNESTLYQRAQFGNLPPEKLEKLQAINSDYNDLTQEIYAKMNGTVQLPEDREKLALLEKEKIADLAKILTPEEIEDYQLRSSTAASQLRYSLASLNPTEAEFRALYRATTAVDAQLGPQMNVRTMDDMKKRSEALLAQLQGVLPPERLADVKMAVDPEYSSINRVVARLALPPATSQTVVALQKDIQQRATALRSDRALTTEARTTQLAALVDEATTKLTTALSPRGLEVYKQNGGYWLQNLNPPPPRPATSPAPAK